MKIEIDQSGKIEDTTKDTVLAFSNDEWGAIVILAKVKRQLQEEFRRQGQPRLFITRTFTAGIVYLLKLCPPKVTEVVIDQEYPGKEPVIKAILMEMLEKEGIKDFYIDFRRVGKKSLAHHKAYGTAIKKLKPKKSLTLDQLRSLAIKK